MPQLLAAVLVGVAALGSAPDAAALPRAQKVVPQERPVVPQIRYSLDQAISIARREVPGRVVGARSHYRRGRVTHEVKILTERGSVHVVRVDGESGRVSH
jgi:uncharacterized membrane protein YkoI